MTCQKNEISSNFVSSQSSVEYYISRSFECFTLIFSSPFNSRVVFIVAVVQQIPIKQILCTSSLWQLFQERRKRQHIIPISEKLKILGEISF